MNYDFIEIGTSDFDTLIEVADDETVGLSIEPLQCYLDRLPNKKNVIKICAAVSPSGNDDDIDIYYIPPEIIEKNNYHIWLRGCNRIGEVHSHLINHPSIKDDLTKLMVKEKVKQITIPQLYEKYDIHQVEYLKIDTEGYDCHILQQLLLFLKDKDITYYPKRIMFETNTQTDIQFVHKTINDFVNVGYKVKSFVYNDGAGNTILIRG